MGTKKKPSGRPEGFRCEPHLRIDQATRSRNRSPVSRSPDCRLQTVAPRFVTAIPTRRWQLLQAQSPPRPPSSKLLEVVHLAQNTFLCRIAQFPGLESVNAIPQWVAIFFGFSSPAAPDLVPSSESEGFAFGLLSQPVVNSAKRKPNIQAHLIMFALSSRDVAV